MPKQKQLTLNPEQKIREALEDAFSYLTRNLGLGGEKTAALSGFRIAIDPATEEDIDTVVIKMNDLEEAPFDFLVGDKMGLYVYFNCLKPVFSEFEGGDHFFEDPEDYFKNHFRPYLSLCIGAGFFSKYSGLLCWNMHGEEEYVVCPPSPEEFWNHVNFDGEEYQNLEGTLKITVPPTRELGYPLAAMVYARHQERALPLLGKYFENPSRESGWELMKRAVRLSGMDFHTFTDELTDRLKEQIDGFYRDKKIENN